MLKYWLFRLAGVVLPRVPGRWTSWLAAQAGGLAYRLGGTSRANLRSNLRHVLGQGASEGAIDAVGRQVFRHAAKSAVNLFQVPYLTGEELARTVTVNGWEHIEEARARGKGVIVVSGHFAGSEMAIHIAGWKGLHPVFLSEQLVPPALHDYVSRLRSTNGARLLPIGVNNSLKQAFRTLRQNGVLSIVADRDVTHSGRPVPFFGATACLPDGHVTLALRTGAAIIMGYSLRRPDDGFDLHLGAPIFLEPTGDQETDVQAGTERVAAAMETYIGAHPEQWTYFQRVWVDPMPAIGAEPRSGE